MTFPFLVVVMVFVPMLVMVLMAMLVLMLMAVTLVFVMMVFVYHDVSLFSAAKLRHVPCNRVANTAANEDFVDWRQSCIFAS
jgi:hypothetical protein